MCTDGHLVVNSSGVFLAFYSSDVLFLVLAHEKHLEFWSIFGHSTESRGSRHWTELAFGVLATREDDDLLI